MLDQIIETLKNFDELKTAKVLLDTFAKYASTVEEYDSIAKWYMEIKEYPLAIRFAEKALVNTPTNEGMYACRANLSKLYNHINDPKASLRYSSTNLKINPEDYDAKMEQVFSYFLLNEKDKSEQILRDLKNQPDIPEKLLHRINFNLGTYDLYKGEFQKGLRGFLIEGKKIGIWKDIKLPFKFWDGGIQPGKTLVICAEGGIGDELINIRFVSHLDAYGMNPIWFTTRPDLIDVFRRHGIDARSSLHDVPKDALWTYSMSIPVFLDLQPDDLWDGPYLVASPEYVKKWKWISDEPMDNHPETPHKPQVGIRWTGNPAYEHDLHREVPLKLLYDTVRNKNYKVYSLQRDHGADEIHTDAIYSEIIDLQYRLEHIEDTLAVIHNLDFVVTSCTSIAHMAASMGKKVYILVPISAYYTWASTTDTSSIWYGDNVTVLRQVTHKSWAEPLKQLEEFLK